MIGKSAAHYVRIIFGLDQPETQTTAAERECLASFLPSAKTIVEIGVFEGFTTRFIADRASPGTIIYGVDPFFGGRLRVSWGEKITRHVAKRHLASGRVRLIKSFSTETRDAIPKTVDLVFIDGDHSLDGIKADWAHWKERVVSGGIIALHDTLLMPDKPDGYSLGSIEYFRDHILHDLTFDLVNQTDSLSILRKR